MSVSTDTERIFRIGGYVKRAKLNLRNEREIRAFHRNAIERRFGDFEDGTLVDVYIDITGYKETAKRPEMLRLMRDCADGKVNLIFAETKGYLSANTREFCYWLHFIFNLKERVDIITDDDQFNINTILNADKQREALIKMAEDYIYLNPPDHQKQEIVDQRLPVWRPQDADREYYRYETKKRIQHYTVPPQTIFRPAKPTPTIRDAEHKRVAVYARVSTKSKEQVSSIENQTKYYTEKIAKTPNWDLAEIYSDEGKSGTSTRSACILKRRTFIRWTQTSTKGSRCKAFLQSGNPAIKVAA